MRDMWILSENLNVMIIKYDGQIKHLYFIEHMYLNNK